MSSSISSLFFSAAVAAALLAAPAAAQIGNWDIVYQSLETDFQDAVANEISLEYRIGAGRTYSVDLFDKNCVDPITGMAVVPTTLLTPAVTADHDQLDVLLDLDKSAITASNIWSPGNKLEFCVRIQLLSGGSVIKEDLRDIDIAFDFVVDFDAEDSVAMQTAAMTSGSGQANVDSYVSACKCDDLASFACNSDPLTPSSILNVCIQSMDADVEIAFLNRLELFQSNVLGDQTLIIVDGLFLQNAEISSMTIKNATAVGVSTVVPSRFFSYGGLSTATVSGVVQVKFVGSRRLVSLPFGAAAHGASEEGAAKPASYDDESFEFEYEATRMAEGVASARVMRSEDDTVARRPGNDGNENEATPFEIDIQMKGEAERISFVRSGYHNSGTAKAAEAAYFGALTCFAFAFLW